MLLDPEEVDLTSRQPLEAKKKVTNVFPLRKKWRRKGKKGKQTRRKNRIGDKDGDESNGRGLEESDEQGPDERKKGRMKKGRNGGKHAMSNDQDRKNRKGQKRRKNDLVEDMGGLVDSLAKDVQQLNSNDGARKNKKSSN